MPRVKKVWADPNREGKNQNRQGQRFCARCGNTVQQARILKSRNLCEFCVKELETRRDGIHSCRGCGQLVAPEELRQNKGYCGQCVCPACGRPDPQQVRKTGLCYHCSQTIGDFCRVCGKEAAAQVRKNHGLCDNCAGTKTAVPPVLTRQRRQPRRSARERSEGRTVPGKPKRQLINKAGAGKRSFGSAGDKSAGQSLGKTGNAKKSITIAGSKPRRQSAGKSAGLQRPK
jgi:hypothetical protein